MLNFIRKYLIYFIYLRKLKRKQKLKKKVFMSKTIEVIELPFEEGKTYQTTFNTKELFTISNTLRSAYSKPYIYYGYYNNRQNSGLCAISADRLLPEILEL